MTTSIKIKFRPSTVEGKEGGIYFQIIHNRMVRQLNTDYKVFACEWDAETEEHCRKRQPFCYPVQHQGTPCMGLNTVRQIFPKTGNGKVQVHGG